MEIVLKDIDGNEILSPALTQWDQGVDVIVRHFMYTADQVHFHFYNQTKTQIVEVTPEIYTDDTGAPCLRGAVPNILLQEPHSIIMHVYTSNGGDATSSQTPTTAQTVFTAQIHVEPRMRPDNFVPLDNTGAMTIAEIRDDLGRQLANWEARLDAFCGYTPTPVAVECYYDSTTQKMYSNATHTTEITGETGMIYQDAETNILYFYDNNQWVEWSVSGAIDYCKSRADACDTAAQAMHTQYIGELALAQNTLRNEFSDALHGCVVRVDTTAPTASSYGNETRPVITFVIGA